MITCLYCGNQCLDSATICPKCGKPLPIRPVAPTKSFTPEGMRELIQREKQATVSNQLQLRKPILLYIAIAIVIVATAILVKLFG